MSDLNRNWSEREKLLLRFFFIYFAIQIVPLDYKFYTLLLSINWAHIYYGDIFNLAHYYPKFITGNALYNWLLIVIAAVIGTLIWTKKDKNRKEYNTLYYWLRVLLRYRLALGAIAYGFIKLFPLQSPYPSISQLNTDYGDFTAWKLFSVSLGTAPLYESFLGFIEILSGVLLLCRKTTAIGAFVAIAFTGNIFLSNLAYEGGEYGYALYLISIAVFLFAYDAKRLKNLLILGKPAVPDQFHLSLQAPPRRIGWYILKGIFTFLVIIFYGFKTYDGYKNNPHNIPVATGLANAAGVYNVALFRIGKDTLPYSNTDTVRWQEVVFEKWATVSIKSNRFVIIDSTNVEQVSPKDADKNYEAQGTIGRHYYAYTIDAAQQNLVLRNKNPHYKNESLLLHYDRPSDSTIILKGLNEKKDSIYVVLNKVDKKYLLIEGRRKPQTL